MKPANGNPGLIIVSLMIDERSSRSKIKTLAYVFIKWYFTWIFYIFLLVLSLKK